MVTASEMAKLRWANVPTITRHCVGCGRIVSLRNTKCFKGFCRLCQVKRSYARHHSKPHA